MPLALLIIVTLAAGVTLAVLRAGEEGDPKVLPTPTDTFTIEPSPTFETSTPTPSPEPTETETPSPEPTETETPSPEPTETETPSPEPTESPDGDVLADTGGPTTPFFLLGALLLLLSMGLWRLSRAPA